MFAHLNLVSFLCGTLQQLNALTSNGIFLQQSNLVTSEQGEVVALIILHLETFPESFFIYFNEFLIQDQECKK